MMKSRLGAQLLCLSAILVFLTDICQAHFPANESTNLNFPIPTSLHHNVSWPHAASMFGRAGLGPEGSLVLPVKMFGDKPQYMCDDIFDFAKMNHHLKIPQDSGTPFILLVERGNCTFVRKVRNAQHLGAAAVLIADVKNDKLPYSNHTAHENSFRMADDGSGSDISIPSMMIAKNEYMKLKKVINSKPNSTGIVVAEISWHVPKFVNKVTMDLWYSPINTHTKQFMASNFSVLARAFDLNEIHGNSHYNEEYDPRMNLLRFYEHPVLLDGKALGCLGNTDSPDEPCYNLCTNGGRYCHASHRRSDGKDVVKEALRRKCIAKDYKSPKFYWDYIDHFSKYCWDADFFANEKCVEDAYKHSNIDKSIIDSCFEDSGDPDKDTENALLQRSLDLQIKLGIHKSPSVAINHDLNAMLALEGLNPHTVLYQLCETFAYGQKPHVCYACRTCGDVVACARRSPMKCLDTDGVEKEDPNAHKGDDNHGKHHKKKHGIGRFFLGMLVVGGCFGGYVYYKKMEANGDGLGSYSLQDAFLSDVS
eukprot:jgi/Psemu1/262024/estExt_Genewise1Plus.C_6660019